MIHTAIAFLLPFLPLEIDNPLDDVNPSLGPFEAVMESQVLMIIALIWFLCILACIGFLAFSIAQFAGAKIGRNPDGAAGSAAGMLIPGGGLVLLASLGVIVGVLL